MSKIGDAKTLVFANCEIPKDAPSSVPLKNDFLKGEKICFRAFFEKTFGDYVKDEKAVAYAIRFYLDGEKYQYFAGMKWNIDKDQYTWTGFQDEVLKESLNAFNLLKRGKHSIEARVYMHVINPTKQYQVTASGAGLNIRDASGTMDGSLVATAVFNFENADAAPQTGVDLSKIDPKLKEAVEMLQSKDFMQRLDAADVIRAAGDSKDFAVIYPAVKTAMMEDKTFGPVFSSLLSAVSKANGAGIDVSDVLSFIVPLMPKSSTCTLVKDILENHPDKKAFVKGEIEKANLDTSTMEMAQVLQACR